MTPTVLFNVSKINDSPIICSLPVHAIRKFIKHEACIDFLLIGLKL